MSHGVIHLIIVLQKSMGVYTTNFLCFKFIGALTIFYKELTVLNFLPK